MSEMVSNDVKNGMELLMTKLLPMVIEKLKNAEAKIAELETKVSTLEAPKPKRTRTKKEKPASAARKPYPLTDEQLRKIQELYQNSVGVPFDNVEVETDEDGTNLTVNTSPVTTAVVDSIKKFVDENPAATVQDICNELKESAIVVCFVMVMFNL